MYSLHLHQWLNTLKQRSEKRSETKNQYINFDFIRSSAAEVERLRITIKYILPDQRLKHNPNLLGVNLFLKVNLKYWIQNDFTQTMVDQYSEHARSRIGEDESQESI